jgi:hypothetical protein
MWYIFSRQELWSQQRQPLLENGSADRHERNNSTATAGYKNDGKQCSLRGPCYTYVMQQ